ncbi:hypothetical protein LPN01_14845 [Sphingomonas sp. A2-49]|uniref:hypothetical protein n=1 Tax=Sphingomonas sp. A2-49 TaxID=1391375 RepID=UPI0021D271EF|nr:hypothetical protein [Sphingomonas sp. A2-49]MCU6455357.1 hypothetical protein [Sphingomonas sp. A2-49]
MRHVTTLAAAALMLAACSGGGESANNEGSGGSAAVEPVSDTLSVDPQNTLVPLDPPGNGAAVSPVPLPSIGASPVAGIPAAFQGRWGMGSADCEAGRADAKGLLTIAGDRLAFYESRGTATHVRQTQPGQIVFDLAMSGEGQTWTEATTLTAVGDGRTLLRETKQPAGSFRYSRCPA